MKFSVIIPVYNRPDEVDELLGSLKTQRYRDFEVIIVEDGSDRPCKEVTDKYASDLDIKYFSKPNSGPGSTRNYGAERSSGEYLIFLDSDTLIPEGYFQAVNAELDARECDAFGGPDREHESFTVVQKAISYSMTSFFTTGGIRGGRKKLDKFYPRSFNMGIKKEVFEALGGFSSMRFGEDIDLSIRIFESGYSCRLFPEAWVYHKRRTDFNKFFKQVHNSGIARINLHKKHPGSLKLVHLLPAVFTIYVGLCVISIMSARVCGMSHAHVSVDLLMLYSLLILIDSGIKNGFQVGLYSVAAAFVQLIGYGSGFLYAWWMRCVRGKGEMEAFKDNFYK